ncbi:MAG: hypothetical protein JNK38_18305 [Acidobacteria bacterium]|nr:hypothetical protein [Acidobacteriota bacterium]
MPSFKAFVIVVWIATVCANSNWAQSAPPSVFIETERIFNRQGEPFTQFVLSLNRSLQRAPNYSWQVAADGWAGGEDPYFALRLEACRRVERGAHAIQSCGGMGMYYEVRTKGASPVAAISAEADWFHGRVKSYASFERAFMAPTFSYYHAEASAAAWERGRFRVSAGVLSRTIQRAAAKLALDVTSRAQLFATAGSGQATVGANFRF